VNGIDFRLVAVNVILFPASTLPLVTIKYVHFPLNAKPKPVLDTHDLVPKESHTCLTEHRATGTDGGVKLKVPNIITSVLQEVGSAVLHQGEWTAI
jgi:hypothetical protein